MILFCFVLNSHMNIPLLFGCIILIWNRSCPMHSVSFICIYIYQINSIHAVLVSEVFSWESPWRPSSWNSLVTRCKSRDSEGLRIDLVSSLDKGRLPSHVPFQLLSNVAGLSQHKRKEWTQNEATIISLNQYSYTKLPSLRHPGISRHTGWEESKRTENIWTFLPKGMAKYWHNQFKKK